MMSQNTKFKKGDLVRIKGMDGTYTVTNAIQENIVEIMSSEGIVGYVPTSVLTVIKQETVEQKIDKLLDLHNNLIKFYEVTKDEYYLEGANEVIEALKRKEYDFVFPFQYDLD